MQASSLEAVSAWRAAWLLTRLRLRRQYNQIGAIYRNRKPAAVRTGAHGKRSYRLFAILAILLMVFNCVNLSRLSIANMEKTLGAVMVVRDVQRGWLGLYIAQATTPGVAGGEAKAVPGVLITGLVDGGAAKAAGLAQGDILVKFDGRNVGGMSDLQRLTSARRAGAQVAIAVLRGGASLTRNVILGAMPEDAKPYARAIAPAAGGVLAPGVVSAATLAATLLLLSALFMALANREMAQPEWDLEWLATLPLPLSTLISSRIVERSLANAPGLVMLGAFLSALAWQCGYRWGAPLVGLALAFPTLFVAGALQTAADTGLRLSLSPPKLRNLQAIVSIVAALPLMLALSMAAREDIFVFGWAAALPDWMNDLPPGLAVRALAAADFGAAAHWTALMLAETLALILVVYAVLLRQLRNGVVATGGRERGARAPRPVGAKTRPRFAPWLLSVVQRRELLLLARDRTFMAQTLLLPLVTIGAQVVINARANILVGAVEHPETLAAIAFGLAAYTLMFSAFQTINAEGQALWILYCLPQSLEAILRQKAKLWAAAASVYPVIIFAVAIGLAGHVSTQFAICAGVVLAGAPIFAVIATALGVFASDPLAQDVRRRVRPTYIYLYATLASFYAYAIFAANDWARAATMILTALLAVALWQKARDQLDYLLDPSASPPARVSASDGLIAALMFFVLQAVIALIFKSNHIELGAPQIWIAFSAAGAATYLGVRLIYWRAGTALVPRLVGPDMRRALLWGLAGGLAASLVGLLYIETIAWLGWLPALRDGGAPISGATAIWLAALAVVAAPLFEEFIFRGLIFGGLRRSFGLGAATLASAAIFAIVHPPLSAVPVFFMAISAALIYERTKMLAAPMAVHAIYNAVVLGFQWNIMQ